MTEPYVLTTDDLVAPVKVDLPLAPGVAVVVTTEEGAVRRGRRRWRPFKDVGVVSRKHRLHERCWHVRINGYPVVLFTDELALATPEEESP